MPDGFNTESSNSTLGLQLIGTLADQLEAQYRFESIENGTTFTLSFPKKDYTGIGNAYL